VAGHVAEELVSTWLQVKAQLMPGSGRLSFYGLDRCQRPFVDGQAVRTKRQAAMRCSDHDELVVIRALVFDHQANVTCKDPGRSHNNPEVALGHPHDRAGTRLAGVARRAAGQQAEDARRDAHGNAEASHP
jgi:hypothetical protein